MLHSIPQDKFGSLRKPMTHAVESCVHCGFCLAACPTYGELGQEMDTPRGRIVLMKQALEGTLPWAAAQPHVDRCLGCLACEPACPSGVPYRDLISPFRSLAEPHFKRPWNHKLRRFLVARTLPYPSRLRLLALLGVRMKGVRSLLPKSLRPMLDLLPGALPAATRLPSLTPAQGERRARVALLLGCAQQVFCPDINVATIEVLSRNGVEVVIPDGQGCCGGLAWHTGDLRAARRFAQKNIRAFPEDVDAIVSNAAGCGSALREYHLILGDAPDPEVTARFERRIVDVSVFLARLGMRALPRRPVKAFRICYQDACHLLNGQSIYQEPRQLLASIPGVELVELSNSHLCCGSAGTYNLDQPEIAASLGWKKAQAIVATGADCAVTGNIGCLMQLQKHLAGLSSSIPVRHTIQILRDASCP